MTVDDPVQTAPEMEVLGDLGRKARVIVPLLVLVCAVIWGVDGVVGAVYGAALILVNFFIAAKLISTFARTLPLLWGMVMFGYLLRLGVLFAAVYPIRNETWISVPALGVTMIVTHLGLLIWEIRYVSLSLAYPGLNPKLKSR